VDCNSWLAKIGIIKKNINIFVKYNSLIIKFPKIGGHKQQKTFISPHVKICTQLLVNENTLLHMFILGLHFSSKTHVFVTHILIGCSYCLLHPVVDCNSWLAKIGIIKKNINIFVKYNSLIIKFPKIGGHKCLDFRDNRKKKYQQIFGTIQNIQINLLYGY
jgi:hypothetical protein